MWQHRWAVWSGVLGATASCLAKLALSKDEDSPLQWAVENICVPNLTTDLDVLIYQFWHGTLEGWVLQYNVDLMWILDYVQGWIESLVLKLYIFEVDWCQFIALGPRILCFVSMLLMNAYMIAAFLKGMQLSGSVVGTSITTASNFIMSALYGGLVWKERFAPTWWIGFGAVLAGVVLLSTVQAQPEDGAQGTGKEPKHGGTKSDSHLVDRSFPTECPACHEQLFDKAGESEEPVADMSPNCYHIVHAKCLQKDTSDKTKSECPSCQKSIAMFVSSKQAAHFGGFWIERVEACLRRLGPTKDEASHSQPRSAASLREQLRADPTLAESQKRFLADVRFGKGLQGAIEWGGSIDYNADIGTKGHGGWNPCLRTRGLWRYDAQCDDLWLWEWGPVHPRQRCDLCDNLLDQSLLPCRRCEGSSKAAFYCSEDCLERDRNQHDKMCDRWQKDGPSTISI